MQLCFDKDIPESFHFEGKKQWHVIKSVKTMQKIGVYQLCFIENTYLCKPNLIKSLDSY